MKWNKKPIKELCSLITTGATLSSYNEAEESTATHKVLTGSALGMQGEIDDSLLKLAVVNPEKKANAIERFIVQAGDVVLMARGNAVRVALVTEKIAKQQVIASANFLIIRPNTEIMLGETIVNYFSTPQGQSELDGLSRGSVIKHISASSLRDYVLPVPSMEAQRDMAELFHLSAESYQSTLAIAEQERKTVLACISKVIFGEVAQ